jgi:nicotinamide-nucleotide amidase
MRAEILAFGTEILMGEIVDTNSAHIAARLPPLGVELQSIGIVGDEMGELTAALRRGMERSDIIFVTGGLGPTKDDMTRHAIALVLEEEITIDQGLLAELETNFRSRNAGPMPPGNVQQAESIPSAQTLRNPMGTAPGWWAEKDGHIIVTMPGVPSEMEVMWEHQVAPRLRERATGLIILSRNLKTFGLSEAAAGDAVAHLFGKENPYLGIYARQDGIHLRIIAKGATEAEAQKLIDPVEAEIRQALGPAIWGVDDDTAETRVLTRLREEGLTLAVMESCTGGLLSSLITDAPGSVEQFRGSIVAYPAASAEPHGVDPQVLREHGPVSAAAAAEMARVARRRLDADIGLGVTGVAGSEPENGVDPGTVFVAVAWDGGEHGGSMRFPPRRPLVKRRAVTQALLQVLAALKERTGS